ncbi:MAG: penicillin-binding protein 2 [Patescibacteria group bacterium]|nr:penicillin-binding protein 2 [Patescibacteria group bacterium]
MAVKFRKIKTRYRKDNRLNIVLAVIFLFNVLIVVKLFNLQIVNGEFFQELAEGQHNISQKLIPKRGKILLENPNSNELYPIAINQNLALVYADPRKIENSEEAAKKLLEILNPIWKERLAEDCDQDELDKILKEKEDSLKAKLAKKNDPYEILAKKITEEQLSRILDLKIEGINYRSESIRYYTEGEILSQITGFVSYSQIEPNGQYGIEGNFDELLKGEQGSFFSEKDARGYFIFSKNSEIVSAQDGADIVLTIDRAIQFKVCEELKKTVEQHSADSGSIIVMDPSSGAIIAMCNVPFYDANFYNKADIKLFNNPIISDQYEPGSIFKAITMAAGLDNGAVSPNTVYNDEGCVKIGVETICNSDLKAHGRQTMTNVLEESLNTGVIFIVKKVGIDKFKKQIEDFGFGNPTGIELRSESGGNISALNKKKEIYAATASFGQGIAVTSLQMVNAFAAIANNGKLMKPYLVKRIINSDGSQKDSKLTEIRQVVSKKTALLLSAMLASVVENGHGKRAGVKGYYVAGKTGTAQVPKKFGKGYEEDQTIGLFSGFAPVEDPRFAMLVKIDNPKDVIWAESTAAPLFGRLAKFILDYYQIEPNAP